MVVGGELGEAAAAHLLVKLSKLASHPCLAGAEHVRHVGEAGGEALRSLEEDQGGAEGATTWHRRETAAVPAGHKPANEDPLTRKPEHNTHTPRSRGPGRGATAQPPRDA